MTVFTISWIFQSTLPRGSDDQLTYPCQAFELFQSTLPRGSDIDLGSEEGTISLNFNPRSLAGATTVTALTINQFRISIHAPSRERHGRGNGFSKSFTISIHAPSRERLDFYWPSFAHLGISIHAPSRERHCLPFRCYWTI